MQLCLTVAPPHWHIYIYNNWIFLWGFRVVSGHGPIWPCDPRVEDAENSHQLKSIQFFLARAFPLRRFSLFEDFSDGSRGHSFDPWLVEVFISLSRKYFHGGRGISRCILIPRDESEPSRRLKNSGNCIQRYNICMHVLRWILIFSLFIMRHANMHKLTCFDWQCQLSGASATRCCLTSLSRMQIRHEEGYATPYQMNLHVWVVWVSSFWLFISWWIWTVNFKIFLTWINFY